MVGEIGAGLLVSGVQAGDTGIEADRLVDRITAIASSTTRDRMNLSLRDTGGGLLLVPQFTLAADTSRGLRASFRPPRPCRPGVVPAYREQGPGTAGRSGQHGNLWGGYAGPTHKRRSCHVLARRARRVRDRPVTYWRMIPPRLRDPGDHDGNRLS